MRTLTKRDKPCPIRDKETTLFKLFGKGENESIIES